MREALDAFNGVRFDRRAPRHQRHETKRGAPPTGSQSDLANGDIRDVVQPQVLHQPRMILRSRLIADNVLAAIREEDRQEPLKCSYIVDNPTSQIELLPKLVLGSGVLPNRQPAQAALALHPRDQPMTRRIGDPVEEVLAYPGDQAMLQGVMPERKIIRI